MDSNKLKWMEEMTNKFFDPFRSMEKELIKIIEDEGGFIDTYVRPGTDDWMDRVPGVSLTSSPGYVILRVEVRGDEERHIMILAASEEGSGIIYKWAMYQDMMDVMLFIRELMADK